jgi:hypothetical protein
MDAQQEQQAPAALLTVRYLLPILGLTCAHISCEQASRVAWLQMGPIAEEQGGAIHVSTTCSTAPRESASAGAAAGAAAAAAGGGGSWAEQVLLVQAVRVEHPPPGTGFGEGLGAQELAAAVHEVASDPVNLQEMLGAAVAMEGFDARAAAELAQVAVGAA